MEFLILDHCGTGTVLCGIVGKTRFKFDVWSNDVNFANKMESTGKPGQVHISEKTYKFLKDDYLVEEGEMLAFIGKPAFTILQKINAKS